MKSVFGRVERLERERAVRVALDSAQAAGLLTAAEVEATLALDLLRGDEMAVGAVELDRLRELTSSKEAAEALVTQVYAGLLIGCEAMRPATRRAIGWPDPDVMRVEQAETFDNNVAWVLEAAAELLADVAEVEARGVSIECHEKRGNG